MIVQLKDLYEVPFIRKMYSELRQTYRMLGLDDRTVRTDLNIDKIGGVACEFKDLGNRLKTTIIFNNGKYSIKKLQIYNDIGYRLEAGAKVYVENLYELGYFPVDSLSKEKMHVSNLYTFGLGRIAKYEYFGNKAIALYGDYGKYKDLNSSELRKIIKNKGVHIEIELRLSDLYLNTINIKGIHNLKRVSFDDSAVILRHWDGTDDVLDYDNPEDKEKISYFINYAIEDLRNRFKKNGVEVNVQFKRNIQ